MGCALTVESRHAELRPDTDPASVQQDVLNAALRDAGITDPDLTITDNYGGGRQMLGPNGEPWQTIEGSDDSGEV